MSRLCKVTFLAGAFFVFGDLSLHAANDSFTGTTDSMISGGSSTQTKRGGLSVFGKFYVRMTTGTAQVNILGNVDVFGNLRVDGLTVGGVISLSTGVSPSSIFVDTIAARSPPLPINIVSSFLMRSGSATFIGEQSTTTKTPTQTTIDGGTVTARVLILVPPTQVAYTTGSQTLTSTDSAASELWVNRSSSAYGPHSSGLYIVGYATTAHNLGYDRNPAPAFRLVNKIGQSSSSGPILVGFMTGTSRYIDVVSVSTDSRVGVNVSSPAYSLDVYGNLNFTGNLTQNGATYGLTSAAANATNYYTIPIDGEVVASSATAPFFPGASFETGDSTCTITKYWFETLQPSQASATFPMFAVAQSSWQFSTYTGAGIATATVKGIVTSGVAIVVKSTSSFHVGIASAPVSVPAASFRMKFCAWCSPGAP